MLKASTLVLALLSGCSVPGPPPPDVLPMDYMYTASALAIDDFGKAQESLAALSRNSKGDLRDRAKAAAAAADIETMRERFKALTEEVAIHMSYPDDYAVAFCPRYKDGSKWIQKREAPLANPYLGKSVPACGGFFD
ncbi:MAG TPA: hypothetical protein VFR18_27125 [Terriglobia bacterium]|nr:hypothetical protein [Terriglobia bacterium]